MRGRHPTLPETAAFAATCHAGQTGPDGQPMIDRISRIVRRFSELFPLANLAERHAIWLHDVLHSTGMGHDDLVAGGFPERVIDLVKRVTPPAEEAAWTKWLNQLADSGNFSAVRIMMAILAEGQENAPTKAAFLTPALEKLEAALAAGPKTLPEDDLEPLDMVPLTIELEPVEASAIYDAARLAERTPAEFVREEAAFLAGMVVATGSVSHVELARERRARMAPLIQAVRTARPPIEPVEEWGRWQFAGNKERTTNEEE